MHDKTKGAVGGGLGGASGPINEAKKRNIIKKRLDKRIFILYKHIR